MSKVHSANAQPSKGKRRSVERLKRGFLTRGPTQKAVRQAAFALWEALDTPRSLGLYMRLKYGEERAIADFRIWPHEYCDALSFRADYVAANLLRKYPDLNIDVDREVAAVEKFRESENSCRLTNQVMGLFERGVLNPLDARVGRCLQRARSKIAWLLSDLDLDEVSGLMRWGPGASSATRGAATSAYNKFDVRPECTLGALHHSGAAVNCVPSWGRHILGVDYPVSVLRSAFQVVPGNRVTCVPKDALIDRVIATEPHMNIYVQLGFGGVIRQRLKRVGIDLDDQTPNQQLALVGSLTGALATVDLSSASDTIATKLVEYLIPPVWYQHLFLLRSPRGYVGTELITYEKFSSMGNGFTFELESLIFWALSAAVLDELLLSHSELRVYGDDIVIPSSAYPLLSEVLNFTGFTVNHRKSFVTGPFRESCGEHYYEGLDTKPVYIDSTPATVVEMFGLINQITILATRFGSRESPDKRFRKVREILISCIDHNDRFFGPFDCIPQYKLEGKHVRLGDGYLIGSTDECLRGAVPVCKLLCERGRPRKWVEGMSYRHFVPIPKKQVSESSAALTWALYTQRSRHIVSSKMHPVLKWMRRDDLPSPTRGRAICRGTPVRFKVTNLEVQYPFYLGCWE